MARKNNGECRMSNVVALVVAAFMVIVALAMNVHGAAWRIPLRFEYADSVKFNYWRNTSLLASGRRLATTTYDTTLTVDNDYWYTAEFQIWYQGEDSAVSYIQNRGNPRTTTAWKIPAKWNEPTDSVWAINYVNGTPTDSTRLTGVQSASEIISVSNDYFYTKNYRLYFAGDTTPYSYIWEMDMTQAASGTTTIPGDSLDRCQVKGYLFRSNGEAIAGALIEAQRVNGAAATGLFAGTNVIFAGEPVYAVSDTSGFFNIYLIRSNKYDPASNSLYNLKATYDGKDLFEVKKIQIPAAGVLNLGDSLVARW